MICCSVLPFYFIVSTKTACEMTPVMSLTIFSMVVLHHQNLLFNILQQPRPSATPTAVPVQGQAPPTLLPASVHRWHYPVHHPILSAITSPFPLSSSTTKKCHVSPVTDDNSHDVEKCNGPTSKRARMTMLPPSLLPSMGKQQLQQHWRL
jgi:hypothetical protein